MKYNQQKIARMFDQWALENEQSTATKITTLVKQTAFNELQLKTKDTLLDIGTGTGKWAIQAAKICQNVIGIDISKKCLEQAAKNAQKEKVNNIIFSYGSFEEPCKILDLHTYPINKILVLYSFHHLPDELKKEAIVTIARFLRRPARIVIGDMMFFENPKKHKDKFEEVNYDGGETDFPAYAEYLVKCFARLLAITKLTKLHPLAGVLTADFR